MYTNTDEDVLDENGLLKDGRVLRTAMLARDALTATQLAIKDAESYPPSAEGNTCTIRQATGSAREGDIGVVRNGKCVPISTDALVTDAAGNVGAALHRPGFRCAPKPAAGTYADGVATARADNLAKAYADAESSRWDITPKFHTTAELGKIYDEVDKASQDEWRRK